MFIQPLTVEGTGMPTLPINDQNVARAADVLRAGRPVVLPLPTPMAYVVIGTDAAAVNTAKQRPASQSAGLSLASLDLIASHLDLADDALPLARWLGDAELVSLMVPVRPDAPGWLAPATSKGTVFFTAMPWLPGLAPIITGFGHPYMSSANLTSEPPATTAAEASRSFGGQLVLAQRWRAAHADR